MTLISKHLSTKQLEEWLELDIEDWDSFYNYIEKLARKSRKLCTMKIQISALGYGDSKLPELRSLAPNVARSIQALADSNLK